MNVVMLAWRGVLLGLMFALFGCGGGGGDSGTPPETQNPANNAPGDPVDPADPADPEAPADPEEPEQPGLEILHPIRDWSFSVIDGDSFVSREVLSDRQVGGALEELVDFGLAVTDLEIPTFNFDVPEDGLATGYIFGSADGKTYGLFTEAPFGPLGGPFPIGSEARLEQRQSFVKLTEAATLSFTITSVFNSGFAQIDAFPQIPNRNGRIESLVLLDVDAYTHEPRRVFFRRVSAAELDGRYDSWHPSVRNFSDSGAPLWSFENFDFDTGHIADPLRGDYSYGVFELRGSRTHSIDLSSVRVGETFTVRSTGLVSANNEIGNHIPLDFQASGANAYLRDPLNVGGATLSFTGLRPSTADMDPPEDAPVEPEPCTSTPAPNPAAGVIQFGAANYSIRESGRISLDIDVTRTGGSSGAVTATLRTSDGTAISGTDYRPLHKSVVFGDGDSLPRSVDLRAIANAVDEENKTLTLTLSDPGNCAAIGAQNTATVTIADDDGPPPAQTFTIGGAVSGLVGTGLVIRDLSFRPLTPGNGAFTFSGSVASGLPYEVSIVTQPSNPSQVCTLANARGVVTNANITNVAVTCVAPAVVGSLDSSFGEAGKVTVGLPGGATATALQSDGKILAVGGLRLVRYNSNGTVDGSFGTAGTVNVVFNGGTQDAAEDVAVQADGKILVAGVTRVAGNDDFAVARYNADGTPDGGFGTAGHASVDFAGAADKAWAVLIQSDNSIVLAGHAGASTPAGLDNDFAVARFTSGGTLDNSFGTQGRTRTNVAGRSDLAFAAALQPDNKIVLTGRVANTGGDFEDTGVVRYNADGTLDGSFNGGTVRRNLSVDGFGDQGLDVVVQGDGKILVAGFAHVDSAATFGHSNAFALSRLNANGSVDNNFGTAGLVTTMFTTLDDFGRGIALQGDGKIVVVGQRSNQSQPDFGVVRYLADGTPDASFGDAGLLAVDFFGGGDNAQDVLVQPDGKLIVSGSATNGASLVMGMIRINP